MKKKTTITTILSYAQQYWFKVLLLIILVYLFTEKDFRFSINLNTPAEEKMEVSPSTKNYQTTQKKEIFTERKNESKKILDKFQLPTFFGGSRGKDPLGEFTKIDDKVKHEYIKRFAKVVINERRKYGIPSSIILACGLLQSQAGQRALTNNSNNHFALYCSLEWAGETDLSNGECYRRYENAWASFRDHSMYLTNSKFSQLSSLGSTNYIGWANGLEQLNYGEGIENFSDILIGIIQQYGLDELDRR